MKYTNICTGKFIDRPNRFIANVEINGDVKSVHVKNTGRCKELLIPGAKVLLQYFPDSQEANNYSEDSLKNRKMAYDLISVYKNANTKRLINMDSQVPNKVVHEWLLDPSSSAKLEFGQITYIKPESVYGNSRFDFYFETNKKKIYMEVKGVTLENNDIVSFPDAPTARGVKHVYELIEAKGAGHESVLMFVIQMKGVSYFTPAILQDPDFAKALTEAKKAGVKIIAYDCNVTRTTIGINEKVKIKL